ncbi:MAG: RluA family pseudouridine synthase [Myxococcota bacterium]
MNQTRVERAPARSKSRVLQLVGEGAGSRLDLFLATELALSRAQVRRLLDSGAVALDGRILSLADKGLPLPGRGELEVEAFRSPADQRVQEPPPDEPAPPILASGDGWLAFDKPAGMPVHPLDEAERGTLLSYLVARHPETHGVGEGGLRSGVVHRLDVDTSGVMLVATQERTWQRLRGAFHAHQVDKCYVALVEGEPNWPVGGRDMRMWLSVSRHRPARVRVASDAQRGRGRAREIHQHVRLIESFGASSLVEVRPRTGFLHQIRASLAHLGHPVLGDSRYGASTPFPGVERQLLHSRRVAFQEIEAESPLPADFLRLLGTLRG